MSSDLELITLKIIRPLSSLKSEIYQVIESGELVIETKLNRLQYLLEITNTDGSANVYADTHSCKDYPEIYKRMGTL